MDALELFLREHASVHSSQVAEGEQRSIEDAILRRLEEEHLRARPQGLNSILWLLWHMARAEDVGINVILAARPQVLDAGGWTDRLGVTVRDVGTGMTGDDVADLSIRADIAAVRAYRVAVGRNTREVVSALPAAEWLREPAAGVRERIEAQGALRPEAQWLYRFWEGKSKAWFISWMGVGHNCFHLGQASWVRKLLLGKGQG